MRMTQIGSINLNTKSSVDGNVWRVFKRCDLGVRGVLLGLGFEISKAHAIPSISLSLLDASRSDVSS